MRDPIQTLTTIAKFFELTPDASWLQQAAKKVKAVPTLADGLSAAERRALELACKPGNLLLGRDDGLSAADAACEKLARWRLEANRKSTRR